MASSHLSVRLRSSRRSTVARGAGVGLLLLLLPLLLLMILLLLVLVLLRGRREELRARVLTASLLREEMSCAPLLLRRRLMATR